MGLFNSTSPEQSQNPEIRQVEKITANGAKADEKNLEHAIKDLKNAEKTHNKGVKGVDKAQHALDTSVKKEHDTATALNKAEHRHDTAITDQRNAQKTLELRRQHVSHMQQDIEQKRSTMEDLQQRKSANDQIRESKLAQVHDQAASAARAHAESFDGSAGPVPSTGANGNAGSKVPEAQGTSVDSAGV